MKHTYQWSGDFINALDFEYLKTYSFNRGEEYEQWLSGIRKEYDPLIKKRNSPEKVDRFNELTELLNDMNYLIRKDGTLHPFSECTHTFEKGAIVAARIEEILRTEIVEQAHFLCIPHNRDAIVFYDKDDGIVATINICLSCAYMEVKPSGYLNADVLTYDLFKKFFLDLGHDIEEPDNFLLTEKMKEKRAEILRKRNS